ncbi:MAG: YtxH domain-containing protein [Longimicrobiales bacterium]|nr:YtxH domain-containing protein [Longimicrobiales bacterium]
MEYDTQEGKIGALAVGLALGAVIGAGIALLAAPESGDRTRRRLRRTTGRIASDAGDRWEDFADDVKERIDDAVSVARDHLSKG